MLLGLLGGAAGLMLSVWASKVLWAGMARTIQGFFWSNLTFGVPMTPDIRVFGYTLLLALLTGVILGLASFLAATQVAVSMVLLIGAGLLVRGLLKSRAVARLAELTELRGVALVERFPMTGTWTSPIVAETGTGAPRGLPGRTVGKSRFPRLFRDAGRADRGRTQLHSTRERSLGTARDHQRIGGPPVFPRARVRWGSASSWT